MVASVVCFKDQRCLTSLCSERRSRAAAELRSADWPLRPPLLVPVTSVSFRSVTHIQILLSDTCPSLS